MKMTHTEDKHHNSKWCVDALCVNRDPSWNFLFDNGLITDRESAANAAKMYFSKFVGYQTTDFFLCLFQQISMIPSNVFLWQGEKYTWTEEFGGKPAPEEYQKRLKAIWECYRKYDVDPVQICIEVMRENEIHPWATLRMNDAHYRHGIGPDEPAWVENFYKEDFFFEQLEKGHVIGDEYGYFGRCYDFSYAEIRNRYLAYISEVMDRYDFFGLELDFQREIYCFDYKNNPDCHIIMTDFIREIRLILDNAEKRLGHPVRLLVVTHRSPQDALEFGFDVQTWCKEGLVDAVAPSARWECTDSSIPVREWREIVGDDVALFPGVETLNLNWSLNEAEQTKAYAASFFAQGADGIRLNNHHDINDERNQSAWMINAENCLEGRRRFTVTYQDIASGSYPPFHPLPIRANDSIELELGKISEEDKVTVIIDFEGRRAPKLNVGDGDSLKPIQISDYYVPHENRIDEVNMIEHSGFSYDLTGVSTTSQLILDFSGKGTIHYIDIIIESQ